MPGGNPNKNRGGNQRAVIVHEQYSVVESKEGHEFEFDVVQCKHCEKHKLRRRADRMARHLLNECPECPDDIKEELARYYTSHKKKDSAVGTAKMRERVRRKIPKWMSDDGRSSTDEDKTEDDDDDRTMDSDNRVVKILTKLLEKEDVKQVGKKKLADMTVEELDREQKEQNIRLTRLKCERVKDKSKRDATLVSSMERIASSLEAFTQQTLSASQLQAITNDLVM